MPSSRSTPAHIIYTTSEGVERKLHFHSIFTEDHSASTEITKFPVQTGFTVSTHAIRKNRLVSIDALVSNTPVAHTVTSQNWGRTNNSKAVFKELKHLVNDAVVCKVVTNLEVYTNVIFNKFSSQQGEGMMDAIRFKMSGEEIQVKNSFTRAAPAPAVFTVVNEVYRPAFVQALEEAGLTVGKDDVISAAKVGADFSLITQDTLGNDITMTYKALAKDYSTDTLKYQANFSDTDLIRENQTFFNLFSLQDASESATRVLTGVTACLSDKVSDIIIEEADEIVDTALGQARETIYGAAGKIMDVSGLDRGGSLWTAGRDCIVTGVAILAGDVVTNAGGTVYDASKTRGASTPDIESVLEAAARIGEDVVSGVVLPLQELHLTKLTKTTVI